MAPTEPGAADEGLCCCCCSFPTVSPGTPEEGGAVMSTAAGALPRLRPRSYAPGAVGGCKGAATVGLELLRPEGGTVLLAAAEPNSSMGTDPLRPLPLPWSWASVFAACACESKCALAGVSSVGSDVLLPDNCVPWSPCCALLCAKKYALALLLWFSCAPAPPGTSRGERLYAIAILACCAGRPPGCPVGVRLGVCCAPLPRA